MGAHLLKVVLSLFFAIWVAVLTWRILHGDDDNWPQGGAAA